MHPEIFTKDRSLLSPIHTRHGEYKSLQVLRQEHGIVLLPCLFIGNNDRQTGRRRTGRTNKQTCMRIQREIALPIINEKQVLFIFQGRDASFACSVKNLGGFKVYSTGFRRVLTSIDYCQFIFGVYVSLYIHLSMNMTELDRKEIIK